MLEAFGYRFYDSKGNLLQGCGESLGKVVRIDNANVLSQLSEAHFTIACDVTNPLCGSNGAAYIFAPQKGADADMVRQLDAGLLNFARVVKEYLGIDIANLPGAGAAGGLGGAFKAFLNAKLERGIEMVLGAMNFRKLIESSELVITGEGKLDRQTVMGKAPSGVLDIASSIGIPTIAIGGSLSDCEELRNSGFAAIFPILAKPVTLEQAMEYDYATANVSRTAEQIARLLKLNQVRTL